MSDTTKQDYFATINEELAAKADTDECVKLILPVRAAGKLLECARRRERELRWDAYRAAGVPFVDGRLQLKAGISIPSTDDFDAVSSAALGLERALDFLRDREEDNVEESRA